MRKKLKIGIDLDDTINDTRPVLLECATGFDKKVTKRKNTKYPSAYMPEYILGWDDCYAQSFWDEHRETIAYKAPLKFKAREIINRLRVEGHEIYIITARSPKWYDNLENNVKRFLINKEIPVDGIYVGVKAKGELCKRLGIDILVDDLVDNCKNALENGVVPLLMDNAHNRDLNSNGLIRVHSWQDIYDELQKLLHVEII